MKEKTSITPSKDVLENADRLAGAKHSHSEFVERVPRDLQRMNDAAERLNLEAADVLDYQAYEEC